MTRPRFKFAVNLEAGEHFYGPSDKVVQVADTTMTRLGTDVLDQTGEVHEFYDHQTRIVRMHWPEETGPQAGGPRAYFDSSHPGYREFENEVLNSTGSILILGASSEDVRGLDEMYKTLPFLAGREIDTASPDTVLLPGVHIGVVQRTDAYKRLAPAAKAPIEDQLRRIMAKR